jgi:hypothetical protein
MMEQVLRIVPRTTPVRGPVATMGTKVLTEDGTEIRGITRIVVTADVGDIWRAEIHCTVLADEMRALAKVADSLTRWQRLCLKLAGIKWRTP